ncbi:hypothetical protein C8J57DRAFT_1383088, partial [Mycena rebaudengoi]
MAFPKFQLPSFLSIAGVASASSMDLHQRHAAPPAGFTSQGATPPSLRSTFPRHNRRLQLICIRERPSTQRSLAQRRMGLDRLVCIAAECTLRRKFRAVYVSQYDCAAYAHAISLPPEELVGHVEVLHPTTVFDTPIRRLAASRAARSRRSRCAIPPDSCLGPEDTITPACLQTFYRISFTPATQTSNTLLVTGYAE